MRLLAVFVAFQDMFGCGKYNVTRLFSICLFFVFVSLQVAFPPSSDAAIYEWDASTHVIMEGDYNGDGLQDIYLLALPKNETVTIPYGIDLTVGLVTTIRDIVLVDNGDGTFTVIYDPDSGAIQSVSWTESTLHVLEYSDTNADGYTDLIIKTTDGSETQIVLLAHDTAVPMPAAVASEPTSNNVNNEAIVPGLISGSFNVGRGAASYSVPIEVPPGITGMVPTLSLSYSSQGGNGIVGMGWSLGGLSAITRCPKTVAQDQLKVGIKIDSSDRYCIDGQRLVNVTGSYGADGTEYRTEIDSFSRIISYSTQGSGPAYFTVETKSGLTMYYGNTPNSFVEAQGKSTALFWTVNRIEDKVGNYIEFVYHENSATGESYPLQINYTGHGSQLPTRAVVFSYDTTRPDSRKGYVAGSIVEQNWRLTNIKTYSNYANDELVRDYRLQYLVSTASESSRLGSITECAFNTAWSCFSPVTFEWLPQGNVGDIASNFNMINTPLGLSNNTIVSLLGDYNGDGLTDILRWGDNVALNGLYLSKGDGSFSLASNFNMINTPLGHSNNTIGSLLGDYNGDGLTDILRWGDNVALNGLYLSKGDGSFSLASNFNMINTPLGFSNNTIGSLLGDYNGDGLTDILRWGDNVALNALYLSTKGNFISSIIDSLGNETAIEYKPISDNSIYTKGSGAQYPAMDYQGAMYVVSSVTSDNGEGEQNRVAYHYSAAKIDLEGRGFLGFSAITATDQASGVSTTTTFRLGFPHTGSLISSEQYLSGVLLNRTENQQAQIDIDTTTMPPVVFPYTSQSIETSYDYDNNLALARLTTDSLYDSYGNLINVVVANEELFNDVPVETITTTTNNQYGIDADDAEGKRLGRLSFASVKKDRASDGATSARESGFGYDATNGQLTYEILEPNSTVPGVKMETFHEYDEYGNKVLVRTRDPGGVEPDRDATTTYSSDGYFVETVTNALGHSETHSYEPRFGKPLSLVGPNGLPTTWQYDAFGRAILETRADGNTSATSVRDCLPADGCDGTVITSIQSGSAETRTYYDRLGRKLRDESGGFNGAVYVKEYRYDARGRLLGESNNYNKKFEASQRFWSCNVYDVMSRIIAVSAPDAANCDNPTALAPFKEIAYSGFQTTITLHNGTGPYDTASQVKKEWRNALGEQVKVEDDLAQLNFQYNLYGSLETQTVTPLFTYGVGFDVNKTAVSGAVPVVTTMEYDLRGNKISMNDPDKGLWVYHYNAFGELVSQTDANGQTIATAYDALGRITSRTEVQRPNPDPATIPDSEWLALNDGTTTWEYDNSLQGEKGLGKLYRVYNNATAYSKTMSYDALGRPKDVTTQILSENYVTSTSYDTFGRVNTITYPHTPDPPGGTQRFAVKHHYDANGYLLEVRNATTNSPYWKAALVNANGQVTGFSLGSGAITVKNYDDATGRLQQISTTGNLQHLRYQYDRLGNLTFRYDDNQGLSERLTYDGLNRLATQTTSLGSVSSLRGYGYDALGNIISKSDFHSDYRYGENGAGPHAVTSVRNLGPALPMATYRYDANGAMVSGDGRELSYKSFGKVRSIAKGADLYSTFAYNADQMRIVQTSNRGLTVYLDPSKVNGNKLYEKEIKNGITTHINYIHAAGGVVGEYRVKEDGTTLVVSDETHYLHKDHLGSIDVITDESGNVLERMSFNPFGSRRVVNTWRDPIGTVINGQLSNRGFTGHEHMDDLGIIHMNGRLYDPKLGRFLSADPYIQTATNSQSYNRYSYLQNSPLSGTDPSGYFISLLANAAADGYLRRNYGWYRMATSIAAGLVGTFAPYAVTANAAYNTRLMGGSAGDVFRAGATAYASAAAAKWVGGEFSEGFDKAFMHGASQGLIGAAGGGSFQDGFLGGFVSSYIQIDDYSKLGFKTDLSQSIAAAVAGGTVSVIGGGKFGNGAVSAAFVYMFNHAASKRREIRERQRITGEKRRLQAKVEAQMIKNGARRGVVGTLMPGSAAAFSGSPYNELRFANTVNLLRGLSATPQAGLYGGGLLGPVAPVVVGMAPVVGAFVHREAAIFVYRNPIRIIEFTESMFPGVPAQSITGGAGVAAGFITNPHELLR
ncbi:MAG: FG-GAP-like repeat-containing protein [Gammaproteobacteria bacterium]|nr:FG-GAP-like repeat-containing protein [Gammaproteobacteria bacterium]